MTLKSALLTAGMPPLYPVPFTQISLSLNVSPAPIHLLLLPAASSCTPVLLFSLYLF